MPTYTVWMRGITVGRSRLERADRDAGVASGTFRPGLGYDLVQPVFRLLGDATDGATSETTDPDKIARYCRARDALGMALVDESGRLFRTDSIDIGDRTEDRGADSLELRVTIADVRFWELRSATQDPDKR